MIYYKIGDLLFSWDEEGYQLKKSGFMKLFQVKREALPFQEDCIEYSSCFYELNKYKKNKLLEKNSSYELYETNEGRILIYHWATCRFAFAIWPDRIDASSKNICYLHPDMRNQIPMSADRLFSIAGMHHALLQKNAAVLHASFIDFNGSAILFTGPSQTGKSTQSALWTVHAGAEIINDDRALLRKKDGRWFVYGYPCCGSSSICINRTLPLWAIVMLRQGTENRVEIPTLSETIRSLVLGIEVYLWDRWEIDQALLIAEEIARQVEILRLTCRPDADAVRVLRDYLTERGD